MKREEARIILRRFKGNPPSDQEIKEIFGDQTEDAILIRDKFQEAFDVAFKALKTATWIFKGDKLICPECGHTVSVSHDDEGIYFPNFCDQCGCCMKGDA